MHKINTKYKFYFINIYNYKTYIKYIFLFTTYNVYKLFKIFKKCVHQNKIYKYSFQKKFNPIYHYDELFRFILKTLYSNSNSRYYYNSVHYTFQIKKGVDTKSPEWIDINR